MTILLILATESLIQPIQKSLFLRLDRCTQTFRQLFEQFALFLGELGGHCYIDDHQLVTAPAAS